MVGAKLPCEGSDEKLSYVLCSHRSRQNLFVWVESDNFLVIFPNVCFALQEDVAQHLQKAGLNHDEAIVKLQASNSNRGCFEHVQLYGFFKILI